jgi:hypothetical protein
MIWEWNIGESSLRYSRWQADPASARKPGINGKLFGKQKETWGLWDRKIDE